MTNPSAHTTTALQPPLRSRVALDPAGSGCWLWTGNISPNGYGRYGSRYAHRLVFEALVGPIAEGLDLDHLCRVRGCVNPAHLEPVSRSENLRRGDMDRQAAKTHCRAGHPYSGDNLYVSPRGSRGCRACMRDAWRRCRDRRALRAEVGR